MARAASMALRASPTEVPDALATLRRPVDAERHLGRPPAAAAGHTRRRQDDRRGCHLLYGTGTGDHNGNCSGGTRATSKRAAYAPIAALSSHKSWHTPTSPPVYRQKPRVSDLSGHQPCSLHKGTHVREYKLAVTIMSHEPPGARSRPERMLSGCRGLPAPRRSGGIGITRSSPLVGAIPWGFKSPLRHGLLCRETSRTAVSRHPGHYWLVQGLVAQSA